MAAVSAVDIANMALSHVGDKSIEAFSENSAQASKCNTWYDASRRQALEAFDWSFARKRRTLALDSDDAPSYDWSYRYQFPAEDCLVIRRLVNPAGKDEDKVPFDIELNSSNVQTIVTDLQDATAVYTFDQEETNTFSALFVQALALLLASNIITPLSEKSTARKRDLLVSYERVVRAAEASNANQAAYAPPRDADWIRGR